VNRQRKGFAAERKVVKQLEAAGYFVIRSAGSHGVVDILAVDTNGLRAIQVKCGDAARCSPAEREALQLLPLPPNATREIWVLKDYARQPLITRL
jgi:Holliday junction resolvase